MKTLHFLFAVALAACAGAAAARPLAEISIIDRTTGERLQTWEHRGRLYVVGQPGNRYAIQLRSRARERLLAVLSVDGVNAVSGETAAGNQSGYILAPHQRAEILGWRKSLDDVAAFYFTALPDSYAARTGRPANVGVIGVALYREYVAPPPVRPTPFLAPFSSAGIVDEAQAPAAKSAPEAAGDSGVARSRRESRLGTGHGERVTSPTQYADFRRASDRPATVMTVYYDSYANLVAMGVIPGPRDPRPFPGGFVPDPGA